MKSTYMSMLATVHRSPKLSVLLMLFICFALGSGAVNVKFNDDYRVYFSEDNIDLKAWESVLDTYSRTDPLIVTFNAKDGSDIFEPQNIVPLIELTEQLWQVDFVTRVDSVSNFQHLYTSNEEIIVEDLADKSMTSIALNRREIQALEEPSIYNRLLSADGKTAAIYLQLMIPKEENAIAVAAEKIRSIQHEFEQKHSNLELRLGGIVMLNAAFDEYARADMATLFPLMFLIFCVMMGFLFRSVYLMCVIVISVIATVFASFGLTGYLGIALSPHSSVAPHIIFTITIAMGIHVALAFLLRKQEGMSTEVSLIKSMEQNFVPISLTSITTAIGFLAMLYSEVPPFQHLGIMCAIGVCFAYINTMLLVPALLSLKSKYKINKKESYLVLALGRYANILIQHRSKIFVLISAISVIGLVGINQLRIDDHPIKLFEEGTSFRDDADFIDENLAGTTNIHFSLKTGKTQGISEVEFLTDVEKFKQFLLQQDEVRHVQVISDTIKRVNKALNYDDPTYYRFGDSNEANAQFLLFYEANLPFGQEINNEIDIDKSSIKLTATIRSSSSAEIIALLERSHAWVDNNVTTFGTRGVSVLVMFSYMMERLASNMISTALLAVLMIAIVLSLALKSMKLGLISLIPNLLPISIVFGFWSWSGKTLDFSAVLIFSMTLGVVVDDTVHFCSKYINALRSGVLGSVEAVRETFKAVGPALVVSTFALSAGFLVFTQSVFHMNVTMGLLSSLTFMVALILDFTLLPILLLWLCSRKPLSDKTTAPAKPNSQSVQISS